MKLDKPVILAIIVLVAVATAASGYYGYEMWKEKQPLKIEKGDFAEIYYIGYLENGSVFDSSFGDENNITKDTPFDEGNYSLTPKKVYISDDTPSKYPDGWVAGDYNVIQGWWEGMLGMVKGDEKTLTISEAYGMPVKEGVVFLTNFTGTPLKFMITSINMTNVTMNMSWMPEIGKNFTMPMYWDGAYLPNPYWVWKNATQVISFNETNATIDTIPNKFDNLTLYPFWENETTASFDDTTISLTTTPVIGSNFTYYGYTYTVENVTADKINISITYGNETYYQDVNKTLTFNRIFSVTRVFNKMPGDYLEKDLEKDGYSMNKLAGKTLYYKIKVLNIYRV